MSSPVEAPHTSTVTLTLRLSAFGWAELERRAHRESVSVHALVARASSHFEDQLGSRLLAGRVPAFPAATEGTPRELRLDLPDATWHALGCEAARQHVSLERLLAHAALFYLADADGTAAR